MSTVALILTCLRDHLNAKSLTIGIPIIKISQYCDPYQERRPFFFIKTVSWFSQMNDISARGSSTTVLKTSTATVLTITYIWWRFELTCKFCAESYNDAIMRTILKSPASRLFTRPFIQGTDPRTPQSSASLAFVRGIHHWQVNSQHKVPVTRKMFHMTTSSWQCAGNEATTIAKIFGSPLRGFVRPHKKFRRICFQFMPNMIDRCLSIKHIHETMYVV